MATRDEGPTGDDAGGATLERIRAGDVGSLERLLGESWEPLVRYLRGVTGSDETAEDAAQEAFVRLWERRERWSGGTARAVLFRIGRNVALDLVRRDHARDRATRARPEVAEPRTPDDALREAGVRDALTAALAALPERRREVFELVRLRGMSHREVADVLELSPQTVANHVTLALRDLRAALADHVRDDVPRRGEEVRSGDG